MGSNLRRRALMAFAAGVSLAALTATPAAAEGGWYSYWSRVLTGVDSRTWVDKDTDLNNTYTGFRYCSIPSGAPTTFQKLSAQLTYENTWTPDENMGHYTYYCKGSAWQNHNYGRLPKGSYHVTLMTVNGTSRFGYVLNVGNSTNKGVYASY